MLGVHQADHLYGIGMVARVVGVHGARREERDTTDRFWYLEATTIRDMERQNNLGTVKPGVVRRQAGQLPPPTRAIINYEVHT